MAKSPDAFRTISEVSAWLETPPHVLRFWESKFPQVKPVKRAGGRRYYRPEDMALLGGIKVLLHEQGMTIRGVQKMLREQGVRHVSSLSAQAWEEMGEDALGEGAGGDEAVLDEAPGEVPGEVDADGTPLDGVIVGPWSDSGAGQGAAGEAEEAEADLADLAALDGPVVEEAEEPGPPAPAPTLIEAFLAGTLSRLAQGEAGATAAHSDGTQPGAFVGAPPVAPAAALPEAHPAGEPSRTEAGPIASERPPLPPGEPSLARALDLLRRADPERLRARADRIAPLLLRLRRLRDGLPRPSA